MVTKIADLGYVGVEPAGYPGTTVEGAAELYKKLGLQVKSAHLGLPVGDSKDDSLKQAEILGVDHIVSGFHRLLLFLLLTHSPWMKSNCHENKLFRVVFQLREMIA